MTTILCKPNFNWLIFGILALKTTFSTPKILGFILITIKIATLPTQFHGPWVYTEAIVTLILVWKRGISKWGILKSLVSHVLNFVTWIHPWSRTNLSLDFDVHEKTLCRSILGPFLYTVVASHFLYSGRINRFCKFCKMYTTHSTVHRVFHGIRLALYICTTRNIDLIWRCGLMVRRLVCCAGGP